MRKGIPKKLRKAVFEKCDGRCGYCGEALKRMVIDHIIPYQETQDDSLLNLMPSCQACNNYKGVWSLEFFRLMVQESVLKCRQYSVNYRFAERYGLVQPIEKPVIFYFETLSSLNAENVSQRV